jgi:hypothetical protein
MHRSLGASSKQLTDFFNVQKNQSFSLENNNTINTYIHSNDRELVRSEPISPLPNYTVTFSKFNEINSSNQNNNFSMSSWSSFTSNNFLFNSPLVLTEIKNIAMPFSPVFSATRFEQHLNPSNVFSPLFSFNSQPSSVDFLIINSDKKFENLLFHFAYRSSFLPFPSNTTTTFTVISTSQKEFKEFARLFLHVFSSSSSFYYSIH